MSTAPHRIEIRRLNDGSFYVQHHHKASAPGKSAPESQEFSAPDAYSLVRHISEVFGAEAEPDAFDAGGVVEETGMAMVHKGEKITPVRRPRIPGPVTDNPRIPGPVTDNPRVVLR
jgi:hypothetical protein